MGDFFKGWRRKAGVVTLAMAMLLTDAWIRSISTRDSVGFRLFGKWNVAASEEQSLQWGAEVPSTILWNVWTVPYWSIVLPLTLLSAWLILAKPRNAK